MQRKGKRSALIAAGAALAVLAIAGMALKDRLIEEWWIYRLHSDNVEVQVEAVKKLGELRAVRALPALFDLFADCATRMEASFSLTYSQEAGRPTPSLEYSEGGLDPAPTELFASCQSSLDLVTHAESEKSKPYLLKAVGHPSSFVRCYVCIWLPVVQGRAYTEDLLARLLKDDDLGVRAIAEYALEHPQPGQ